jgi:YcxB-like protein
MLLEEPGVSIPAEGKLTIADAWRGARLVARKHFAIAYLLAVVMWSIALLLTVTGAATLQERVVFYLFPLFLIGYYWVTMFLQARLQAKGSPNLQGTVSYAFNDLGYVVEGVHARGEIKWSCLVKWKEGKHCFAIYTSPKIAHIIPKRFFQSPADVEAVRGFLQATGASSS